MNTNNQAEVTADTSAKRAVMDRLRTTPIDVPALPEIDLDRVIEFEDPIAKFSEMLALVGGQAHVVDDIAEVKTILDQIAVYRDARRVVSNMPEIVEGNLDAQMIDDPHALATLDWTIAKGEFMVAENGAIWIDGNTLPHRVLLFIAQYLAIVVDRSAIVSNMHQAYDRIDRFDGRFGVFVSGPSKTADIEQSLVLGAHGCRKLQVFII
ncbi:MAG: hypothetical protein CBB71_00160 [Rhodopirellula sp. TMED11]|nr:MAG: hypothetical protein CBB71_00160 [Rhodopirellula sp. TMED11]